MKNSHYVVVIVILLSLFINVGKVYSDESTIIFSINEEDWTPIIYADNNSPVGYSGLFVDILDEIFTNRLEIKLQYKPFPWARAQLSVQNGKSDFMVSVPTEQRLEYAVQSDNPIFELYMHLYTYKGHQKIEEIKKIKNVEDILRLGLVPVTNLGNGWHKENIDSCGIQTYYIGKDDNLARFLAFKRADIMIDTLIPMNYKINKMGLESKIEVTDVKFGPIKFHLLISKKSKYVDIIPKISSTINNIIEDGTLNKITSKYTTLKYNNDVLFSDSKAIE